MSGLHRYAFIFKGPGCEPATHRALVASPLFSTTIIGVSTLEEACAVAAALVDDGVQLIDLCGAFSTKDLQTIRDRTGDRIPIGAVRYTPAQQRRIAEKFADQ